MSYSKGVFIHNFNEDQFGADLQAMPKPPIQSYVSVTQAVHGWKNPVIELDKAEPAATQNVERHILFGHAGDMRDPHVTLQKQEFATANQYFLQDPARIDERGGVGTLTA